MPHTPNRHAVVVTVLLLALLAVAGAVAMNAAAVEAVDVELTFETGPAGDLWVDGTNTDFGYLNFTVFTPVQSRERSAVATQVPVPDPGPEIASVITNQNDVGDRGWLYLRFRQPQPSVRLVMWLEPADTHSSADSEPNSLRIRGYDATGRRVYEQTNPITAGGYIVLIVNPPDSTDRITRLAVTVRDPDEARFIRFYVSRVEFSAHPPAVSLTISPAVDDARASFTATAVVHSLGAITDYHWEIDGTQYTPRSTNRDPGVIHPILPPGTHSISVTVTDRLGIQNTTTHSVFVQEPTETGRSRTLLVVVAGLGLVGATVAAILVGRHRRNG